MKKFIVAVVLLAILVPAAVLAGCGGNKVPAGAIAAVGSGVVTQQQFDAIWQQAQAQYKNTAGAPAFPKEGTAAYDQLRASIVNYLVQNQIIKDKAAELKVTVTDKQFQDRMLAVHREGQEPSLLRWVEAILDAILASRVSHDRSSIPGRESL